MADEKNKESLGQVAVRGAGDDGKVVLWERHPQHPKPSKLSKTGEIFISNDGKTRVVAETPEVKRLLGTGRLVLAKAGETAKAKTGETSVSAVKTVGTEKDDKKQP